MNSWHWRSWAWVNGIHYGSGISWHWRAWAWCNGIHQAGEIDRTTLFTAQDRDFIFTTERYFIFRAQPLIAEGRGTIFTARERP